LAAKDFIFDDLLTVTKNACCDDMMICHFIKLNQWKDIQ